MKPKLPPISHLSKAKQKEVKKLHKEICQLHDKILKSITDMSVTKIIISESCPNCHWNWRDCICSHRGGQ